MVANKSSELAAPSSQSNKVQKKVWSQWINQLPKMRFQEKPNNKYELMPISFEGDNIIAKDGFSIKSTEDARKKIEQDMETLNTELMPLFRVRDHAAKRDQNRYRRYQLSFIFLATCATGVGSFQVWALQNAEGWILILGLIETVIALLTTFIATLMGTRQPLADWLENRRLSEQLRREYFRYVMDIEPYDKLERPAREKRLAQRAAAINNRTDPDSIIDSGETPIRS